MSAFSAVIPNFGAIFLHFNPLKILSALTQGNLPIPHGSLGPAMVALSIMEQPETEYLVGEIATGRFVREPIEIRIEAMKQGISW